MILVTGTAGFIGSHLTDALLERGEQVVGIDDFNGYYSPSIKRHNIQQHLQHSNYRLIELDIRDTEGLQKLFAELPIQRVVHLAARAGVRPSLNAPELYIDVNLNGTLNLLQLCKQHALEQFVFASSSSVYGANTKAPFREDAPLDRPVSPYAATKGAGELLCYNYHHLYGIPITCLRFFTAYGPRQRPDMAIHRFTKLIYEERPVPFFGDGTSQRDYTYITDIIQGILATIDRPLPYEVFNLGESSTITLTKLVSLIEEVSGRKAHLDRLPPQAGDVEITYADVSKAREMLGYQPTTPIRKGLELFIEWFEEHRNIL